MSKWTYIYIVGTLIMLAVVIVAILIYRALTMNKKRELKGPIYEKEGIIIDKRENVDGYKSVAPYAGVQKLKVNYSYYIMFEFKDGTRRELKSPYEIYSQVVVGDKGLARYRENILVNYKRYINKD